MTRLSVVVPCFDVDLYVEACVRSVLDSDFEDLELICVDDGSSDDTLRILEALATTDSRIAVIEQTNQGAAAARNVGLGNSSGEFVQFLDADDLILRNKLSHQHCLAKRSGADLVAGPYEIHDFGGRKIGFQAPATCDPLLALMQSRLGSTCSNLFRTAKVREIGGWDESLASSQEADLMLRLLQAGARVEVDQEPLTIVRQGRADSISSSNRHENLLRYTKVRRRLLDHVVASGAHTDAELLLFRNTFFDVLQRLSQTDPRMASELYAEVLGRGFVPETGRSASRPLWAWSHRVLGFGRTQAIRKRVRELSGRQSSTD